MKKLVLKIRRHIRPVWGLVVLLAAYPVLHFFRRDLLKKDIWLVCEKRNEARDNGYHFYRYLKKEHPEINSYYVITQDAADLHKVKQLGNIIYADTFRHALYYLAAVRSISSQAFGAFPFGFTQKELRLAGKLCNPSQKTVFLQHGIIKDELSHEAFDYNKNNIDFFVCSARREYEFVKEKYGYPDDTIGCVGLCRFDHLHRQSSIPEKMILVMPTWRFWLKREKDGIPLTEAEVKRLYESEFYKHFSELITSAPLKDCLKAKGYKLYFYMHYQMQDYSPAFMKLADEMVIIADRHHYDVQDLLMRTEILVTDYSSVQFDAAYMNKPMIYFQFDKERFENGHYQKGYFDYSQDGFGPCYDSICQVSAYLQEMVCNGGVQPEQYQRRIDSFFHIRDEKNCERTYEAILNL